MRAITTFPEKAWDIYAKICVESMRRYWPGSICVYFEGPAPPAFDGVEFRPLISEDRTAFLNRNIPETKGFLHSAKRFCHKVFAQLETMEEGKPFWWIDADVCLFDRVPLHLLEQVEMVTYLGRDSYTETGLIGFNPKHPDFPAFHKRYKAMYTEGKILDLPYWTDCHAFDSARRGLGENLTPGGTGFENVMERSKFGAYMAHYKGPRKVELYRRSNAIPAGI